MVKKKVETTEEKIKCWICHRFKEPSTWVSIGSALGLLATQLDAGDPARRTVFFVAAACGILGIILSDGTNAAK